MSPLHCTVEQDSTAGHGLRPRSMITILLFLAVSLALLLSACVESDVASDGSESTAENAASDGAAASGSETVDEPGAERKPIVRLALTDWTGSRLVAVIAEQIIELRLGYPVELVGVGRMSDVLADLEDAELDAILEVWPSTLSEGEQAVIDEGRVMELGPLGPVGQVGWFVPRYVVEEDPTFSNWEGFLSPEATERFATEQTAPRGRFLGIDVSYESVDEQLIDELGLPLVVEYSGSEAASRALLAEAVGRREPILMYWWTPTNEVQHYDLVAVELPKPVDGCPIVAESNDPAVCAYPQDLLFKLGAADLADRVPDVAGFLAAFHLSTEDQLAMITRVEVDEEPLAAVARDWVERNETTWAEWLSTG